MDEIELKKAMTQVRQEYLPTAEHRQRVDKLLASSLGIAAATLASEAAGQTVSTVVAQGASGSAWTWGTTSALKWISAFGLIAAGAASGYLLKSEGGHGAVSRSVEVPAWSQAESSTDTVQQPADSAELVKDSAEQEMDRAEKVDDRVAQPRDSDVPRLQSKGDEAASSSTGSVAPTPEHAPMTPEVLTQGPTQMDSPTKTKETPSIAAEIDMIAQADQKLRHGAPQAALALLEQHEIAFRDGQMRAERAGLRALANCVLLGDANAKQAAGKFAAAHPNSPLAHRIKKECSLGD